MTDPGKRLVPDKLWTLFRRRVWFLLGGTAIGGRLGDRHPKATTLTASAAATALTLLLLVPLSTGPVLAVALVFLMALAGFTVNPVVTSLAVRFAGDAPTLASALTTSAYNTGIALAGQALDSSLGLTGPALIGAVSATLTDGDSAAAVMAAKAPRMRRRLQNDVCIWVVSSRCVSVRRLGDQ